VRRWLLPSAWVLLLLGLSSIPGPVVDPPPGPQHYDKIVHFLLYGVLGFLLMRAALLPGGWTGSTVLLVALVTVIGSALGALDEYYQSYIPRRNADVADWLADTAGSLAGALVAARRYGRPRPTCAGPGPRSRGR
jgi:VanZ family protein